MKNLQKRIQFLSLILMAGLLFFSVIIPAKAFIQKQGTVNEAVVLRQNADASSSQVMELTNGQAVTVNNELTGADGTTWYQIFVDKVTVGYVPANTITISEGSSSGNTGTSTPGTGQTMQTVTVTERVGTVTASTAIRVRAQATTSSNQIASMEPKDTFIVVGDANGADGYVWHEIDFDDHGTMVHGYVRSDLVSVKEVTHEEQIPVDNPVTVPDTPSEPEAPYSITSQVNAEGTTVWYLTDDSTGDSKEITSLLQPQEVKSGGGIFKVLVVILLILVIAAAGAAVFFYMRWQDAEAFIYELREKQVRARKQPAPATRTAPAVQTSAVKSAPVQPSKPVSQSSQPVSKPVAQPTAQPVNKTVAQSTAQPVNKPVAQPTAQPVTKPVTAQPVNKPVTGQPVKQSTQDILPKSSDIVRATKQELQNKQTGAAASSQTPAWKSKNFLTDDDDLEFDFLDMDDK